MAPLHYRLIFLEAAGLLLVAAFNMPYAFYKPMRICILIASIFLIVRARKTHQWQWYFAALPAIILFTPGFNVSLPKPIWIPIDILFCLIFVAAAILIGKPYKIEPIERRFEDESEEGTSESFRLEWNQPSVPISLLSLFTITVLVFSYIGHQGDATSCPDIVYDERGSYCAG